MLSKLVKELKREALANKGKAGVLGLVVAVALYFWMPLFTGWFTSAPDAAVAAPTTTAVAATTPAQTNSPTENQQAEWPAHPWSDLIAWMDNDPMMKSTGVPVGVDNPFRWSAPPEGFAVEEGTEEEESEQEELLPEVTPQSLGMVLTSTLIGPKVSIVKISGKTFVFDRGATDGDGQSSARLVYKSDRGEHEFGVLSVKSGFVTLSREDKQYQLTIRPPTLAGDENIQFLTAQ